jgi:hypothetical protein
MAGFALTLAAPLLGPIVRTRQSGGASLNTTFVAVGTVTLASAVFTGLWKTRRCRTASWTPVVLGAGVVKLTVLVVTLLAVIR